MFGARRAPLQFSARIGYATKEQTNATGNMLDRVNEWAIDFHFDWRRGRRPKSGARHHRYGSCGRGFRSLFVYSDECLVKDLRDVEVIIRLALRHLVKIRAALRLVERGFHP